MITRLSDDKIAKYDKIEDVINVVSELYFDYPHVMTLGRNDVTVLAELFSELKPAKKNIETILEDGYQYTGRTKRNYMIFELEDKQIIYNPAVDEIINRFRYKKFALDGLEMARKEGFVNYSDGRFHKAKEKAEAENDRARSS